MKSRGKIKKPKFIFTYLQCLTVVAAFLACIGYMIYSYVLVEYTGRANKMNDISESGMISKITTAFNRKEVTSQDIAKLKQELLWHYSSTGQCFEVYYNQQKVADSSRTMIMHYSPEAAEGESQLYFFDLADEKYLKYFDTPEILKYKKVIPLVDYSDRPNLNPKFNEQPVLEIGIKEAYINLETGKFIPVKSYVFDPGNNHMIGTMADTIDIPVDKDSPELKGYTYIKATGNDLFSGSIEGAGPGVTYYGESVSRNDYGVYYGYKSTDISFVLFNNAFKTPIMIGNCVLVVAMLAISFIPASFIYSRRKRNYEIFEYRRKMTDAMAHDLKTPMAAILSYAENLENHTGEDKQEFYVSKITEKVWQMNRMVNSMLDFSRAENTTVTVKKAPVDIGTVLADAISENEHEITNKRLTVSYEKAEVTVNTDKDLFAQAIGNLINNAALYAREESTITVTCDSSKVVIINVAAVKVEDAEAMKQPFAKGSESRRNYGTGLGLAIADNNLTLLGFKLDVKSEDDKFVATVTM